MCSLMRACLGWPRKLTLHPQTGQRTIAGMHGVGGSVDVDADVGTLTRGRDADDERIGDAAASAGSSDAASRAAAGIRSHCASTPFRATCRSMSEDTRTPIRRRHSGTGNDARSCSSNACTTPYRSSKDDTPWGHARARVNRSKVSCLPTNDTVRPRYSRVARSRSSCSQVARSLACRCVGSDVGANVSSRPTERRAVRAGSVTCASPMPSADARSIRYESMHRLSSMRRSHRSWHVWIDMACSMRSIT